MNATEHDGLYSKVPPSTRGERLVAMFDIDENGTNFPTFVFDPEEYVQADYYTMKNSQKQMRRRGSLPYHKKK
jgi:hypothetical protein